MNVYDLAIIVVANAVECVQACLDMIVQVAVIEGTDFDAPIYIDLRLQQLLLYTVAEHAGKKCPTPSLLPVSSNTPWMRTSLLGLRNHHNRFREINQ